MRNLENQMALVTGASRGIGRAITLELGRQGAYVIGTGTSDISLETIDNLLKENNINGSSFQLDVADADSVDRFIRALSDAGLQPAILVNNAGITRDNLLMRMKDEEWDAVLTTNLTSLYRLCKALVRAMMKARFGRIINIASVVGQTGNPGQTNYAAAKAGMLGFTKALARELGTRGITVNAVAPGFIETDMTRDLPPEQRAALMQQIPLARLGAAAEVAAAVAFLASPGAAYITGETINVNGGMYMP